MATSEHFGQAHEMDIDHRVAIQNAMRTVLKLEDALVELITNSDDAYRDNLNQEEGGEIRVHLSLNEMRDCLRLAVADDAGGMSDEVRVAALKYGARSSAADTARSRRGFHGRGLKEAIIALGTGYVRVLRDGVPSATRVAVENDKVTVAEAEPSSVNPSDWGITSDGTEVVIETEPRAEDRRRLDCDVKSLPVRIAKHFALRDIVTRRRVVLTCDFFDRRRKALVRNKRFEVEPYRPGGREVGTLELRGGMALQLYESDEPLKCQENDPYSEAGIIVCAEGIPQDLKVFDPSHPGARFFYGMLECPQLAKRMRSDTAFEIRTDRGGLDWRRNECRQIERAVKKELRPHYERRGGSLPSKVSGHVKASLEDLTKELNKLAPQLTNLLQPVSPGGVAVRPRDDEDQTPADGIYITPPYAYELPGKKRTFSVMVPDAHLLPITMRGGSPEVRVVLTAQEPGWFSTRPQVLLRPSKKHEGYHTGMIEVSIADSAALGAEAMVHCNLGSESAQPAVLRVAEPVDGANGPPKPPRPRGLFESIVPDEVADPPAPVRCADKVMRIYTRFPGNEETLHADMSGASTPRGSAVLSDLVAEGLCRRIIEDEVNRGRRADTLFATFDAYDKLRRVALPRIRAFISQRFEHKQPR